MNDMSKCNDCGLDYEVTWNIDVHGNPDQYCPRCGSQAVTHPIEDEEAE